MAAACAPLSTTVFVDGGTATPLIDQDGAICTPFATIQQGIDATTAGTDWTVAVTSGSYDENLVVPADRQITLASMGQVSLGGVAPGNITWTTGGTDENYLQLTAWSGGLGNPGFGAGVDEATAGWIVGGTITVAGTTTATLCLEHVNLVSAGPASIDTSGMVAAVAWLISRWSNIQGAVTDGGTTVLGSGNMRIASPLATTFLSTVNAVDITNANVCEFDGNVTLSGGDSGVFTGCIFGGGVVCAGSVFEFDGVTYDVFVLLGNSFGVGGALGRSDLPYEGSQNTAGPITVDPANPVVFVDTSGGPLTISLPPTPFVNDECKVMDDTGDSATNPITIDGNGNTIDGTPADTIATPYGVRHYKFAGSVPEWKVIGCCSGVLPPDRIFGADLKQWVRADDLAAGAVAAWNDRTANANNFAQGTGANQPVASTSGGPNSTAEVTFDGVNDGLDNTTLNLPVPPFYVAMVVKQITWTIGDRLWAVPDFGTAVGLACDVATPQIAMFDTNVVNNNSGALVGQYKLVEAQFTNSASDFLRAGGSTISGANAGNHDPAVGINLGYGLLGGNAGNISVPEFLVVFGTPTALQRALFQAYIGSRYGSSVIG